MIPTMSERDALNIQIAAIIEGGKAAGYNCSSELMEHSIQSSPKAVYYYNNSALVKKIKKSSGYKSLLATLRNNYKNAGAPKSYYETIKDGATSFEKDGTTDGNDLYYAIHGIKGGSIDVENSNATIYIKDIYDYAQAGEYGVSLGFLLGTAAYRAQELGIIKKFDVHMYINESFSDIKSNKPQYPGYYIQLGSTGSYVKLIQEKLISLGFSCGKYGADGKFGTDTKKAVKSFQGSKGLYVDGVVGSDTWNALFN